MIRGRAAAAVAAAVALGAGGAAVVATTTESGPQTAPPNACTRMAWPIPALCLQPGSALTFQLKPGGPYFVMTNQGMTTLEGRPAYYDANGQVQVVPSTKAPGLDPGTVAVVPLYNNNQPLALPATVALTLTPAGPGYGKGVYRASWPASAGATSYRLWQDGIVTGITTLNPVSLALPCGKRVRSNVGPVNATGAAKLAPPVYTDVPAC